MIETNNLLPSLTPQPVNHNHKTWYQLLDPFYIKTVNLNQKHNFLATTLLNYTTKFLRQLESSVINVLEGDGCLVTVERGH